MKILITGAAGQLGHELCAQLDAGGSALGSLPERLEFATVIPVDIEDADLTKRKEAVTLIRRHAPDIVINCAAFTNVDAAETERDAAFAVNALAPRNLAMACEEVGARLIHLSTDYVFGEGGAGCAPSLAEQGEPDAGRADSIHAGPRSEATAAGTGARPFTENDLPAPTSVYGSTKLLGERYVQAFCSRWFIVRTAWLYGRHGHNFVKTMLRLADEREKITVVNDQQGNPTNAEDLAHHLLQLVPTKEYGVYHCTGSGICTWFDFATEILRLAGKTTSVVPVSSGEFKSAARRPANSALEHTMLRATIGDHMRPWQEAIAAYIMELKEKGQL